MSLVIDGGGLVNVTKCNNEVLQGHKNRLEGDEIEGDDQDMHGDEHDHKNRLESDEME